MSAASSGFGWRALAAWLLTAAALSSAGLCAGCSDDDACLDEALQSDCSPLYPPTFEEIYSRTLQPTCAASAGACHGEPQGGLSFVDIDSAYQQLSSRVVPGDTQCGVLISRIGAQDNSVMPPGDPLSEAERCSIVQWIANGAER